MSAMFGFPRKLRMFSCYVSTLLGIVTYAVCNPALARDRDQEIEVPPCVKWMNYAEVTGKTHIFTFYAVRNSCYEFDHYPTNDEVNQQLAALFADVDALYNQLAPTSCAVRPSPCNYCLFYEPGIESVCTQCIQRQGEPDPGFDPCNETLATGGSCAPGLQYRLASVLNNGCVIQ